jgi:hypothetical protein
VRNILYAKTWIILNCMIQCNCECRVRMLSIMVVVKPDGVVSKLVRTKTV